LRSHVHNDEFYLLKYFVNILLHYRVEWLMYCTIIYFVAHRTQEHDLAIDAEWVGN
jgi:hypothetical protein